MILTPAGQRLVDAARGILAEVERVETDIAARGNGGPTGLLRVATECYTCYHWLPGALMSFREAWPRVEVRIVPEATRRPLAGLVAGELDLAIVSHLSNEEPRPFGRRLAQSTLFDDELMVIMAPAHRLAGRSFVTEADFAEEHVILYNLREEDSTLLNDVLRPAGVRPRSLSRVELTEAIIELVKANMGISVMSRWAVAPQVTAGTLIALPLTEAGIRRRWSAVFREGGSDAQYLSDFARQVSQHAFPAAMAASLATDDRQPSAPRKARGARGKRRKRVA